MKVLKKGRAQKGWAKEFVCTGAGNDGGGCGAKLLVEQNDLFRTESHCRDETDVYTTFECAECLVWTDIPAGKAPNVPLPYRSPSTKGDRSWRETMGRRAADRGRD